MYKKALVPYIHYSGLQMLSFSFPNSFIKIDSFFVIPTNYWLTPLSFIDEQKFAVIAKYWISGAIKAR
jgi:hypothetical protein